MDQQARPDLLLNPRNEFFGRVEIDRNDLNTARHAGPKEGHPFGPVFAPQQNAIALGNSLAIEISYDSGQALVEGLVGPFRGAVAVVKADRFVLP